MKPLIVLLSVFVVFVFVTKISAGSYQFAIAGRIAIATMLLFTAVAHFAFTKGMAMMLPAFVPFKTEIVYLTGIIEVAGAAGILFPGTRIVTGWLLVIFFILILPANVYAAVKEVDYQNANFNGYGVRYLWFRVPLQVLFIAWTYFSCLNI